MGTGRPVLVAEKLVVARAKHRLLAAVDLTLYGGEIVALTAPDGVRKSTLLSALAGLLPRGAVLLEGRVAGEGSPPDVLEHPDSLDVAEYLGSTGHLREADGSLRCVRPASVSLDATGDFHGPATGVVPEEDGALCEVELPGGEGQLRTEYPGPPVGARVSLRIDRGVRFTDAA